MAHVGSILGHSHRGEYDNCASVVDYKIIGICLGCDLENSFSPYSLKS